MYTVCLLYLFLLQIVSEQQSGKPVVHHVCPGDHHHRDQILHHQATDGIYQVNPLTGQAYVQGMSLRYRILGLPTLYTFLSASFSVDSGLLVQNLIQTQASVSTHSTIPGQVRRGSFSRPSDRA